MQFLHSRSRQALTLLAALLLTSSFVPTGAQAQEVVRDKVRYFSFNRARIGITVSMQADKDDDKIGARIASVTPDGPADKAGLKAGDIVTRFNGTSLGGIAGEDEERSGPGEKLVKLAQKLDEGDTVQVEYRRGSDNRKATLVAEDLDLGGAMSFVRPDGVEGWGGTIRPRSFNFDQGGTIRPRIFSTVPDGGFAMAFGKMRGGLELADITPELGEYFGAKSGVLVLKTPDDSSLGLKAGDVITAIDGRSPTSESQVRRILSSYDSGETAKIEVLRKQKKVTVSWKIPAEDVRWKRTEEPKVRLRTRS
jgi:S1-C subfamily serine protease